MFSFKKVNNTDAIVIKLLKSLAINVDAEAISEELEKHPYYPGLLAVSDILTSFKIENSAFRVEPGQLADVPCPFIAHTNLNNGDFVLVNKIDGGYVVVSNDKWNRHKLSLEEFKKIFAGIVLTPEPGSLIQPFGTPALKHFGFTTAMNNIKTPALAIGVLFVFLAAILFHTNYIANLTWQTLLLTIFKSVGLITSILLLIQSIDSNNPLVQALCQTKGKTNCNAILSSKAAKVFEGLSWSEVGFFYFSATWLLLFFGGGSPVILELLALLNFISLPYTIYSIYYQSIIAKQWCVLCCTVQALLWMEFIPFVTFAFKQPLALHNTRELSTLFICLLSPVILWAVIKPLLLKIQQIQPLKQQLRKFKFNIELFNRLITEQPKFTQPDEKWCIMIGNPEASQIITMVSNPYCPPCAKTHRQLDELLAQRHDLQARIVFTANNTENDIKTPISRHLVALNEFPDKEMVKRALNDWYGQKQKNYESWAKAYPVSLNGVEYQKIDRQNAWCQLAEVKATPTLLLNGYKLPDLYQLTDLKYMME